MSDAHSLPRWTQISVARNEPDIGVQCRTGLQYQNWARTYRSNPECVFWPSDVEQVQKVVRYARQNGRKLNAVGAGHTPGDLTCSDEFMISLDKLCRPLHIDQERKLVTVQAGMRMYDLHKLLDERGLALENLGSISEQSIAGMMATATHGSSLRYSILSQFVTKITMILADGSVLRCSREEYEDVFSAALVHLGALGILVDVTLRVSSAFDISADREVISFPRMLDLWAEDRLWQAAEYTRVWWFPYSRKAVWWKGQRIQAGQPKRSGGSWFSNMLWAYHIQQALLCIGRFFPHAGPAIEKLVFARQYGSEGRLDTVVDRAHESLNMNCLFSQYVDEWALPLEKGIEACRRLDLWLSCKEQEAGIPYSSKGVYVHAPIELRVSSPVDQGEAWLSTAYGGPVCYIGIIMYKPYGLQVPYRRFFQAYEYLMTELGGRPHWAKQFDVGPNALRKLYPRFNDWLQVRERLDPEGLFLTAYHERHLLGTREANLGYMAGMEGRRFKAKL